MNQKDYLDKLACLCVERRKAYQAYLASPEYKALQDSLENVYNSLKDIYDSGDFDTLLESEKFFLKKSMEDANSPEEVEDLELEKQELDGAEYILGLIRNDQEAYRTLVAAGLKKKDFRKDGTPVDKFHVFLRGQKKRLKIYLESAQSPGHANIYRLRKDIVRELEHQYRAMQRKVLGLDQ